MALPLRRGLIEHDAAADLDRSDLVPESAVAVAQAARHLMDRIVHARR